MSVPEIRFDRLMPLSPKDRAAAILAYYFGQAGVLTHANMRIRRVPFELRRYYKKEKTA